MFPLFTETCYCKLQDKLFFLFPHTICEGYFSLFDNHDTEKPPTPSMFELQNVCCRIRACCRTRHPGSSHTSQWDTLCCVHFYVGVVWSPPRETLLAPDSKSRLGRKDLKFMKYSCLLKWSGCSDKEWNSYISCELICQDMCAVFLILRPRFSSPSLFSFCSPQTQTNISAEERFQTRPTDKRGIPTPWIIWHTCANTHTHTHTHKEPSFAMT